VQKSSETPRKTRKRPGAATREERGLLRDLLAGLDIGVALASSDGALLYANPRFLELIALEPRRLSRGVNLTQALSPRSWSDLQAALRQAGSGIAQGDVTLEHSGETRMVRLIFSPIGGDKVRITAMEVTELVETSRALRVSQASLQSLSARILHVEDEERRRLARDLHDNTGQEIAALSLALRRVEISAANASPEVREAVAESISFASKIENQIRTLSYLLHPPLLDEFGLRAAIGWFVDGFTKRSGIDLKLKVSKSLPRFSRRKEIALFRVVQAALANVLRHSGSQTARIQISLRPGAVELAVEDEGKGMSARQLQAVREGSGGGVGIGGMRERLRELGGNLQVNSDKSGTRVIATLPVDQKQKEIALEGDEHPPSESSYSPAMPAADVPAASNSGPGERARILIADDHEIAREGIKSLLASRPEIEVVGEARDGVEAIAKTEELKPDLLILDLSMPRIGGLAAATKIRESGNGPKILVFTTHSFPGLAHTLRAAGCQGYVLKEHASTDLVHGIQEVLHGNGFYCSA
jgi:signal transduction histidine kinase/CheY-like chemotaxis protein